MSNEKALIREYLVDLCRRSVAANPERSMEDVYRAIKPACESAYKGASAYTVRDGFEKRQDEILEELNTCLCFYLMNQIGNDYDKNRNNFGRENIHHTAKRSVQKIA